VALNYLKTNINPPGRSVRFDLTARKKTTLPQVLVQAIAWA